jgi:phenylalanyl-tRNA synthetase beta chain
VHQATVNVLLEGAAWEYINMRRTTGALRLNSEASYRFSRGVHPALAEQGVRRGLQLMQQMTGGAVAKGLVDAYPQPVEPPQVRFSLAELERWLGLELEADQVADLLRRLEFVTVVEGAEIRTTPPPYRLDIGAGVVGMADVMEEIARIYGYDRIPERLFAEEIPEQPVDVELDCEEFIRDALVDMGLQEIVTYRLTNPERERREQPPGSVQEGLDYVRLENPSSTDREVMRRSLLASVLEIVEANAHLRRGLALFEIAPVYLPVAEEKLPLEQARLVLAMYGPKAPESWTEGVAGSFNFFDMKGVVEELAAALRLDDASFTAVEHPSFHPGKTASLSLDHEVVGVFGELHPLVAKQYELAEHPVIAADFKLAPLLQRAPKGFELETVPAYPSVFEDIAIVVNESVAAAKIEEIILAAGGELLSDVRLFDLYRGEQIGAGRKSLAYSLTYQAADRTLTDGEVAEIRSRIVRELEKQVDAELRA